MTPSDVMKVHQYLYYVLHKPLWTDQAYDTYCLDHNLQGIGGSDLPSDYSLPIREYANSLVQSMNITL